MILRQVLSAYYQELDKAFHLYWMEGLVDYGEETAHGIRVNLKRQFAFFHLLQCLDPAFSAEKAVDKFSALYKRAGKIRDRQVERQLLLNTERRMRLVFGLSNQLREKAARKGKLLQEWARTHDTESVRKLAARVFKSINRLPEKDQAQRMKSYFTGLIHSIASFPSIFDEADEALHDLRKSIKELFYNLEIIKRFIPGSVLHPPAIKLLYDLQHILGDWHDRDFSIRHLERIKHKVDKSLIAHLKVEKEALEATLRQRLPMLSPMLLKLAQQLDALKTI
jgi:CHAD domain-containing protein